VAVVIYAGLVGLTALGFSRTPGGFVPTQDKQYLVAFAQLPDASTLDRTEAVIRRISEIALAHPAVAHSIAFPGLSINGFVNVPNSGIVFVALKPFEERTEPGMDANSVVRDLNARLGDVQEAFVAIFPPPPVQGLGTVGGFKLYVEDRASLGFEEMYAQLQSGLGKGREVPELAVCSPAFR
jgi:multidrug efflux pump